MTRELICQIQIKLQFNDKYKIYFILNNEKIIDQVEENLIKRKVKTIKKIN